MLELTLLEATIVACYATAAALDAWSPGAGCRLRVAGDELWIVGPRSDRCGLFRTVSASLRAVAPDALVVDQTDGWTVWSLAGADASHALARLTVMPLRQRDGTVSQGAVAGVPAKVVAHPSEYQVFVPAPVGHHLRDRVLEACDDLRPATGTARQFGGPTR